MNQQEYLERRDHQQRLDRWARRFREAADAVERGDEVDPATQRGLQLLLDDEQGLVPQFTPETKAKLAEARRRRAEE